jgi:hypothetical protein
LQDTGEIKREGKDAQKRVRKDRKRVSMKVWEKRKLYYDQLPLWAEVLYFLQDTGEMKREGEEAQQRVRKERRGAIMKVWVERRN